MNVKLSIWFSGISSFSFSIRAASFGLLNDSSKKACKSFILLFPCTAHFRVCTALKIVRSCVCEIDSDNNPKMLCTESFNCTPVNCTIHNLVMSKYFQDYAICQIVILCRWKLITQGLLGRHLTTLVVGWSLILMKIMTAIDSYKYWSRQIMKIIC